MVEGEKIIYLDEGGEEIVDDQTIHRINSLVIPPNWADTWICKLENGHLQCTGRDERNRKQYLYHPDWMAYRQKTKFRKLKEFGAMLPSIRTKLDELLDQPDFSKDKVLAIAVSLLDAHFLRIGNEYYRSENETYGLTTLRRKHLEQDGNELKISYKAKSNKYRNISIQNKKLTNLLLAINDLPGYEVFRYEEEGDRKQIDSSDVNEFIRKISDDQFSAKDFRTWGGTVSAVEVYSDARKEISEHPRRKLDVSIVRRTAKILGNTVNTAREYYIHPKVLDHLVTKGVDLSTYDAENHFKKSEQLVLDIL